MSDNDGWYQVDVPYAVYGVRVVDGAIHTAAPIAKWAIGMQYGDFLKWVIGKGGTMLR